MRITNNAALKAAYEELIFWKNNLKLKDTEINNKIIKNLKINIRDYFKRMNGKSARIVKWDSERVIWMEILPETVKTKEAAEDWVMDYRCIESFLSPYDRTGRPFSVWHKIFKQKEKYVVYHCICRDVPYRTEECNHDDKGWWKE